MSLQNCPAIRRRFPRFSARNVISPIGEGGSCHGVNQSTNSSSFGEVTAEAQEIRRSKPQTRKGPFTWNRHSGFPERPRSASRRWSAMREAKLDPLPSRISHHRGRKSGNFRHDARSLGVDQGVAERLLKGLTSTAKLRRWVRECTLRRHPFPRDLLHCRVGRSPPRGPMTALGQS